MKRRYLCLKLLQFLCIVFLIGNSFAFESSLQSFTRSHGRSLLSISSEPSTALIAALDGTIHLVENDTKRVIWSFSSGPPIYSAYQQQPSHKTSSSSFYYIDCGDDWELYIHTGNNITMKLPVSIEDFLKTTPHVSDDGAVTLGSKKTTVFEVDPKVGRLIRSYVLSDSLTMLQGSNNKISATTKMGFVQSDSNHEIPNSKPSLKILRTDYTLKSFAADSDKVSWSMNFAEIAAALLCQDAEKDSAAFPLSCHTRELVLRNRSRVLLESFGHEAPTGVHGRDMAFAIAAPSPMFPLQSGAKVRQRSKTHQTPLLVYALILLFIGVFIGIVVSPIVLLVKGKILSAQRKEDPNKKKKKKGRKPEENDDNDSVVQAEGVEKIGQDLNELLNGGFGGKIIGKLVVSNTEIAKGSNGTVVRKGIHDGRIVAVKCLVKAHNDEAVKEIRHLNIADHHPNIVRSFGIESDQDFIYLPLELCACSLDDLIQIYSDSFTNQATGNDNTNRAMVGHKARLESIKTVIPKVEFWKANGHPSPSLLKLMRDVVSGLVHLHQLGIIHRDLKPPNVLIAKEMPLCAKLSDMGISKKLQGDMSSLDQQFTSCGSSGWQAPEQLLKGRQTRAVDLFSLGCVLFFCITGGKHPYGDSLERDVNIVNNRVDLLPLESLPEAIDLISRLLNPDPELRPKASEVLCHPLFWDSERRLSFLRDTSDRVEFEDRENSSGLLKALESIAPIAFGLKWNEKMEKIFLVDIGRYRRYKFDSVRDLLRVMRNKFNHYRELPKEIQELVGTVPEGFDGYFASRFPRLLIEVYKVINIHCKEEKCFQKYYKSKM